MKRKFLSTLLFGALACTTLSTVTSCKDYDDDINNLQEQIDKKAALDKVNDLITQVSNVETQAKSAYDLAASKASKEDVEAAKTAATDAAKKAAQEIADAATTKANEAAAAAKAAQETADKAVADAAAANKAAEDVAGKLKDYVLASELKTQLEALKTELEEGSIKDLEEKVKGYDNAINALYSAVTEVSLVGSFTNGQFNTTGGDAKVKPFDLSFKAGKTGDNDFTFGKDQKDDTNKNATDANSPYTYAKKTQIDFPKTIVVRINPTNAVITPEMIKFIDSKGNDLSKVVKVNSVEKYDGLLTRAGSNTGLWTVELGVADGQDATEMEQKTDAGHILYAMAVNNTADQAEAAANAADRYVVSTYDITIQEAEPYKPVVDKKPATGDVQDVQVSDLKGIELKSETQQPNWTSLTKITGRGSNHVARTDAKDLIAANGESISIRFNTEGHPELADVDRFYVVRDDNHAESVSSPSEINVWKTYQYKGLGEMVEVKQGTGVGEMSITIPSNLATGDQIAFRLFAVNYDGTLVCETGESFNVTVVNPQNLASVTGDIVATSTTPSTGWLPINNATVLAKDDKTLPGTVDVMVNNEKWTLNATYAKAADANQTTTVAKEAKYVKFSIPSEKNIKDWKDGATGTGNITTKDDKGAVVSNISVSLTKKLPGDAEAKELGKYTWKGEQLKNGVFTAYLFTKENGNEWNPTASATNGYKDMKAVLNDFDKENLEYVVENAEKGEKDADGNWAYDKKLVVKGSSPVMVVSNEPATKGSIKNLIDGTTEHATTIRYNFGAVSSETDENIYGTVSEIKTVFACPLAKPAQTYAWKQIPAVYGANGQVITPAKDVNVLTYGKTETVDKVNLADYIVATNTFDANTFSGKFTTIGKLYADVKVELLTNSNNNADYFTVAYMLVGEGENAENKLVFTAKSGASVPVADVASTLKLTLTDAFGHEEVYTLPFTVKKP